MIDWQLYIVRCGDGTLYTGVTTDVKRRINEHTGNRGSKYLRGKGPLKLAFSQSIGDKSLAFKMEHKIKRLNKFQKEALIQKKRLPEKWILLTEERYQNGRKQEE